MLAEVIISACMNSPEPLVSGSQIGLVIKTHFPELNYKDEYQGLTSFVSRYCQDYVLFKGKRGFDNLFIHKNRLKEESVKPRQMRPWIIFSDPRIDSKLFVHIETGEMKGVSPEDTNPGDGYVQVERLSEADYRLIAREFVAEEVPHENRELLYPASKVIDAPGFWLVFANNIKAKLGEEMWSRLLEWRFKKINEILIDRLVEIGINKQIAESTVRQISRKPTNSPLTSSRNIDDKHVKSIEYSTSYTYALIHEAINLMSQDELRTIKLPVGVIIDAMKKMS